jgi:hypothetical protein
MHWIDPAIHALEYAHSMIERANEFIFKQLVKVNSGTMSETLC